MANFWGIAEVKVVKLGSGHLLKSTRAGIDSGTVKNFRFIWVGHENFRLYWVGHKIFFEVLGGSRNFF